MAKPLNMTVTTPKKNPPNLPNRSKAIRRSAGYKWGFLVLNEEILPPVFEFKLMTLREGILRIRQYSEGTGTAIVGPFDPMLSKNRSQFMRVMTLLTMSFNRHFIPLLAITLGTRIRSTPTPYNYSKKNPRQVSKTIPKVK